MGGILLERSDILRKDEAESKSDAVESPDVGTSRLLSLQATERKRIVKAKPLEVQECKLGPPIPRAQESSCWSTGVYLSCREGWL